MTTATALASISFAKLRSGEWGIKGNSALIAAAIRDECAVTVSTRGGETKQVQPDRIVWTGQGVAIASIIADRPARRSNARRGNGECVGCGETEHRHGALTCWECGAPI